MLSVFDNGPAAPCPVPFNMAGYVLAHAGRLGDKCALSVLGHEGATDWSFADIQRAVLGTATGLMQTGLQKDDIVLMRLGNTVEFPIAYLACIAVGLIPVPTSPMLTAPEVNSIITELAPKVILHDTGVAIPDPCDIPVIGTQVLHSFHALPAADFDMGDPDRLAYIIYTSGTSGKPRAVMHAHRAIWARRMMHEGWCDLREGDRLMHAGAFNWTYTLGTGLMDPWSVGATALIPDKSIEITELPHLLKRHSASIFAAAPGVYRKFLISQPDLKLPQLRHGLSAGEKLSETIRANWQKATGTSLYEAYGMSECSTFISASPNHPAPPDTLGHPQVGRRVALVDHNGPVGMGQEGTIAIHRSDPGLMLGYFNAPEETEARFQGDWFLTGDHGVMSSDHAITYVGRADDMMNAGGYRVSPLEVEKTLSQYPGIAQIGVTDIEIKQDVRVIAAFYTAKSDIDTQSLRDYAAQHMAQYKQPRYYQRLDALPTNPNGKLSRRALRETFKANR